MAINKGRLFVNNQEAKHIILWVDTAPSDVEIVCKAPRTGAVIRIWNAWRDSAGTTQAWLRNAGMLVDATGAGVILRCSDGLGPPDFDDLIVKIQFVT